MDQLSTNGLIRQNPATIIDGFDDRASIKSFRSMNQSKAKMAFSSSRPESRNDIINPTA